MPSDILQIFGICSHSVRILVIKYSHKLFINPLRLKHVFMNMSHVLWQMAVPDPSAFLLPGKKKKASDFSDAPLLTMVVRAGIEPATRGFSVHCSTN